MNVTYDDAAGGGTAEAVVTLIVRQSQL